MEMNEYQKQAKTFDVSGDKIKRISNEAYTQMILRLAHSLSGLAEEIGEVEGKFKKFLRGDLTTEQFIEQVAPELGDVLWYLSDTALNVGIDLNDVALWNLVKLRSRKERGKIKGNGDNR